ncbi:hypothetical protein [Streptomyces sp. M41(2017)]|uniref:hypothetical protein n=1 Tax=Streptomyces sp. M41(2017) TaxID=1955065 RepID=UPI001180A496|nr:hypothetical protein [Streptomyces sp. M41(2017)]
MDERRDPEPPTGSRQASAGRGKLSPPTAAWNVYVQHCRSCKPCKDIDQACPDGARLYELWQGIAARALRSIARGA